MTHIRRSTGVLERRVGDEVLVGRVVAGRFEAERLAGGAATVWLASESVWSIDEVVDRVRSAFPQDRPSRDDVEAVVLTLVDRGLLEEA